MSSRAGDRPTMSQIYASEAEFEALFTRLFDRAVGRRAIEADGMDELVE